MSRCLVGLALASLGVVFVGCDSLYEGPPRTVRRHGGPLFPPAALGVAPKASIAVLPVENRTGRGLQLGQGVADMLAAELSQTGCFLVSERRHVGAPPAEQEPAKAAEKAPEPPEPGAWVPKADLLVAGAITEFEPNWGGVAGGPAVPPQPPAGAVPGQAQMAVELWLIDARTSQLIAKTAIRKMATDIGGAAGAIGQRAPLALGLAAYANTPMEKAARACLADAVQFVVTRTPAAYYRYVPAAGPVAGQPPGPQLPGPPPGPPVPPTPPPVPPPPPKGAPAAALPAQVYAAFGPVRVYERAASDSAPVDTVDRGALLRVQAQQGEWYGVQLPDGRAAWILKGLTSLTPPQ